MTTTAVDPEVMLATLTLEEKVLLLTGRDSWSLHPLPRIGLRSIVMSDGPAGVRGDTWDERHPSINLPSPTAVAASWDPAMVERVGRALGAEARRKNVDVLLAPTINLHRSPYGGRHFEAFSEDPLLTGALATAYVRGVQSHGVAATVKHYVANDAETERFTVSSDVDERTLRELYLAAFERPVTAGPAWLVMSAYNRINGTTASEHPLLSEPLKGEWGFDGVVVSDWTAVRSLDSARAAQDVVMPGPSGPWGDELVAAVRRGDIAESVVDDKVRRLLRLAGRVGALDGAPEPARAPMPTMDDVLATSREASIAGTVLLANDGILPLSSPTSIAVIGEGALHARTQGGGSATVIPTGVVSPLDGITERWADAQVTWSRGAVVQAGLEQIPAERLTAPGGQRGMRVRYLDRDGKVMGEEVREASRVVSFDAESRALSAATIELTFTLNRDDSGPLELGVEGLSDFRAYADGAEIGTGELRIDPSADPATAVLTPPWTRVEMPEGDAPVEVRVELSPIAGGIPDAIAFGVGLPPVRADERELIAEAAREAAQADVAIVVVSTSSEVESEGFDRTSLHLPGAQDALVAAVLAANPRTVVVVNSGSPVVLPWREDAAAILATWFPGQEFGTALAAVLSGDSEPGGRLPVTWPSDEASVPVSTTVPTDGHLAYREGIHIGHRAWLRSGSSPAYPFGHGLGYTTWDLSEVRVVPATDGDVDVRATVSNTGDRAGATVVQAYLEGSDARLELPARWLGGFAPVTLAPGESAEVAVTIPRRSLEVWDDGWRHLDGPATVRLGFSVEDLRADAEVPRD